MSGLAAAVSWDGAGCAAPLRALIDAGAHRAPDGVTTWVGPGAALARLHRLSLPGQTTSAEPAIERGGPNILVLDGRLDDPRPGDGEEDGGVGVGAGVRFGAEG